MFYPVEGPRRAIFDIVHPSKSDAAACCLGAVNEVACLGTARGRPITQNAIALNLEFSCSTSPGVGARSRAGILGLEGSIRRPGCRTCVVVRRGHATLARRKSFC